MFNCFHLYIRPIITIFNMVYNQFAAVLSDFEDASNHLEDDAVKREVNLVADSLRLGGAILGKYFSNNITEQIICFIQSAFSPILASVITFLYFRSVSKYACCSTHWKTSICP